MRQHRVLIVTGGLLTPVEPSPIVALRKQIDVHRNSAGPWLDLRQKLLILERILPGKLFLRSRRARQYEFWPTAERLMTGSINLGAPELTEVLLMTLLAELEMPYEVSTYAELAADARERSRLLDKCDCVFASATMLRGVPEVRVVAKLLKQPDNRVVLGGALTGVLHETWPGVPGIDLLAVGYGEWLVPALVAWMRSDYELLEPPPLGRMEKRGGTSIMYSGLPHGRNIDELTAPDWSLAEKYHGKKFPMAHYESVRGCPYRCQFCNYPYLFADDVFRYKSADRIARDWMALSDNGARIINCLDSLFTLPRRRLYALCDALAGKGIRWICYARADDLAKPGVVRRMIDAGCIQVQVGIEAGDQTLLDNMNKKCSVSANLEAMRVCREEGLSTVVSVIIGYPGETPDTVRATLEHLKAGQPDFYYASPFSVLVEKLPVLSPQSKARFGLETNVEYSSLPYWRHDTMDSAEVVGHLEWFNEEMMRNEVSLEASLFYDTMPSYRRDTDRKHLLEYQRVSMDALPWLRKALRLAGRWAQGRLEKDMRATIGLRGQNSANPPETQAPDPAGLG